MELSMKKILIYLFYILFAACVLTVSVIAVPKYAEYRDGNTKARIDAGFYFLTATKTAVYDNESDIVVRYVDGTTGGPEIELPLIVDYKQWGGLVFASAVVFLIPALLLNRRHR